jgi:hypothetical protein
MEFRFSPEFLLMAACSTWPPSKRRTQAINNAAEAKLDWVRFLRVVQRHGVVGLVHDGLGRAKTAVPPDIGHQLAEQARELARINLALAAEALRVQRLFVEENVPVAFIKGVSLAKLAYGNLGLRHSKDLDLLVDPASFPAATALVERAGYCRFEPPAKINDSQMRLLRGMRKDFGFRHRKSQLEIELHWQLFSNPYFMAEPSVLTSTRGVPVADTMELRTLGEEDLFAYLCGHGSLHWWHQMKWLADIGAILSSKSEDQVDRLYRAADARGVGRAAAQAILLCHRLLTTPIPTPLITKMRKNATLLGLEATALNAMTVGNGESDPHNVIFGTTRGSLSCFFLSSSWRYRLAELKNQITCQEDVLMITLPEGLQFLYPVLRLPLWLWRHSIFRGRSDHRTARQGPIDQRLD